MPLRKRREALRSIINGSGCIRPGSVYDATSIRIAEDLGFEVGMFGGSVASLAVLGDPDIALITLTELCEQMRRMSRAAALPVLVDADHGYGNALNVKRTVEELETAGVAGLTIEDTALPTPYGASAATLIPIAEGVQFSTPYGRGAVAVSENGVLAYRLVPRNTQFKLEWMDRKGTEQPLPAPFPSCRLSRRQ